MKALLLCAMLAAPTLAHPQHWRALGRGPQQASVHGIMADTLADRLIVCGDFN